MKKISCWADLRPYGFDALTGEACGLMYRLLLDVTENGRKVIGKCLGMPDPRLAEAWNRGAPADPHVGSIMLSQELLTPIGIFALLESGCTEVWLYANGSLLGVEPTDTQELIERCRKMAPEAHVRTFRYGGTAGDRNVHMMSGRTQ